MVPIPAGSVVGKFVTTTTLYYAPDFAAVTYPPAVMDAGKTLWVIGTDKSVAILSSAAVGNILLGSGRDGGAK